MLFYFVIMTSNKPLEYIVINKQAYISTSTLPFSSEVEWQANFNWELGHNTRPINRKPGPN